MNIYFSIFKIEETQTRMLLVTVSGCLSQNLITLKLIYIKYDNLVN